MKILGITGGSGSGKTTLLRAVEQLGGLGLDCDAIYHCLLETDDALVAAIGARFPGTVRDGRVDRPALAASLPLKRGGRFILMDAGANTECTPVNIVQFAIMGEVYAQYLFQLETPRVSLLSVGGEDIKGNDLTKESFKLLEQREQLNFVGNVEADVIFEDVADVLVTDGFSGNVMLKGIEGLARSTMYWLKRVLSKNALRLAGAMLAKNAFIELRSLGDADDIGGAPLLGINGICIIGHGSSSPRAVRSAIRVAGECVTFGLNERITARLNATGSNTAELEHELADAKK